MMVRTDGDSDNGNDGDDHGGDADDGELVRLW